MTRRYAARALLAHGPMTLADFIDCTRWPHQQARKLLANLRADGEIVYRGGRFDGVYEVAA